MERLENQYMALSGTELLEIIFRKGKEEAAKYDHLFGHHLAYHNPLIKIAIKVECYTPKEEGGPPPIVDVGGFEVVLNVGSGPMWEPDRVRDELGLGVYETKLVDEHSGAIADVKVGETTEAQKTVAKVNRLMGDVETDKKLSVKNKEKKAHRGWPRGVKRGPRNPIAEAETGHINH